MKALPSFLQSVRFRLSALYSLLLFAVVALVLSGIYLAVARNASDSPVTRTFTAVEGVYKADGSFKRLRELEVANVADIEQAVNAQMLAALRQYSAWTLAALFVASLGIGWVLAGRALRPVRRIAAAAESISARDLSQRIRLSGPDDEFQHLATTLDTMLARIDDAFNAQRRLLDDASHELRNPLAIIGANTDAVLLADDTDDAERREAALVVSRATRRMTRLVEDLLATARRNAAAFADSDVRLDDIARHAVGEYTAIAAQRRQHITHRCTYDGGELVVPGDPDALRRAVANLLSNAVRYAPADSTIGVATGRAGDWCWVAVSDLGPGIAREVHGQIFDRFWRDQRADPAGHAGLGLSIVRQIVESHRGSVHVHSELGSGATFVLWLPASGAATDEETPPGGNPALAV